MDVKTLFKGRLFTRTVLPVIALTPLLAALLCSPRVAVGRPVADSKMLTPLAFRQYSVNLREIPATGRIAVPFSFWNRGKEQLEIISLAASCGCLKPKIIGDRKEYSAGAQGLFEVHVDTAREAAGPQLYAVTVKYRSGEQLFEENVTFRMRVPEKTVRVSPPELYFYQLSDDKMASEIRIEDHRGKAMKVVSAVSSSPQLGVTILEPEVKEDGQSTPIRVEIASRLAAGRDRAILTIKTDDPEFPSIQVPVFLHGKATGVQLTTGELPGVQQRVKQAVEVLNEDAKSRRPVAQ